MFFLIYWILPNRQLPIPAVLPTAVVTGLLWELAAYLHPGPPLARPESVYGPFSVSVSLMIWAFLTGLLLLAGAHIRPRVTPSGWPTRPIWRSSERAGNRKQPLANSHY